jgi:hypothetical protein
MGTLMGLSIHRMPQELICMGKQSASRSAWGSPENYNILISKRENLQHIRNCQKMQLEMNHNVTKSMQRSIFKSVYIEIKR